MQDARTGVMINLDGFLKDIPKEQPNETPFQLQKRLDAACAVAQPDPAKRGPIFQVGEVLEIRGGKFQITRIEPGHIRLKGIPSI